MFLEDLYVRPNYRKLGIGQELFEKTVQLARDLECRKLELEVFGWNPAIKFYEKMGAVNCDDKSGRQNFQMIL